MNFELSSPFSPTGDQPEAIAALSDGIKSGVPFQTLLGVTGSGKTFTIANVIKEVQKPTLILSHNKTLAAQLYSEFKAFFPNNAVEYFVSYYDYYQPEAYLPTTDTYIEKDLAINDEIDKLRLRATASLLSGRKDVIVVSSVSCLYGMADPTAFAEKVVHMEKGMRIDRDKLLRRFVDALYVNNKIEFNRGCFRVNGDTVDIFPAIETFDGAAYRIEFWDDEVDRISSFDPQTGQEIDEQDELNIYPTNLFVTTQDRINTAIGQIDVDLGTQVNFLREIGKPYEAKRLYERVTFDLEMIRELGHCSGIENYSRYFDGRQAGERPFCLLDYFPKDFMLVVDESHVTIPQIRAMLFSRTPQPGMTMIRPAARFTSSAMRGIPFTASDCWPEVRIRSQPNSINCSKAAKGSRQTSKARWQVTDSGLAASISRRIKGTSISPSFVRQPKTTPCTFNCLHSSISSNID